ncbi:MAG: type II toxin-antitoxin system RelE/ParE family toxin [Spirochaetales bacterium]|nr:type II toxin-antitoxin system RelE/ParE family toxin [Spirochaetales bacterium]
MRVRFHPEARAELRAATHFYRAISSAVKEHFLTEVAGAQDRMQRFPLAGESVEDEVRRQLLKRFPYSILYHAAEDRIFILAIAHQSRRPGYWKDRLKDV